MDVNVIVYIIVGTVQTLAIVSGGGMVAFRLGRATQRVESAIDTQKQSGLQTAVAINELKADIAALKAVLTEVALQKAAIERLEHWYDELRRGEGFVFPFGSHLKKGD